MRVFRVPICARGTHHDIAYNLDEWHSSSHVVHRLHAHVVLAPNYRRRVMTDRVITELRRTFEEACERFEATLDADTDTDDDHAHLIIKYPPNVALSRLAMSL